jgi:RimJ/RimL family protein N-acetyltransferase
MRRRFAPLPADEAVVLRAWEDRDRAFLVAACNDPDVARFTEVPSPYTPEHARAWVVSARWLLELGREAHLALADATVPGAPPLGAAGLVAIDWRARRGELGYWLAPEARGRGSATRAVVLLRDWAHGPLGLARLVMRIHPENRASQDVARRAGFLRDAEHNSPSHLVFTHLSRV